MLGPSYSLHVRSMLPNSRRVVRPPGQQQASLRKDRQFYAQIAASATMSLCCLCCSMRNNPDFQGASKNFESAYQWDEDQPEVAYNLGLAQFRGRQFASAAEPLRKAETLQPKRKEIKAREVVKSGACRRSAVRLSTLGAQSQAAALLIGPEFCATGSSYQTCPSPG
jgi:tetratricopeptide (TPR) repeat protein